MLTRRTRSLTYAAGAAFALVGAVLFVAPGWAADHFPWRVSPFLAMTMGGWYLGAALFAGAGARDGSWTRSHAGLLFAWVFGLGQGALLLVHADVLDMGAGLAWPYAAALAVAALAAVSGVFDVVRERPERERGGRPVRRWVRGLVAAFVVAVGLLALPLVDGYDSPGSIWPGELTLLSARAFAVFFGALSLSALALLLGRAEGRFRLGGLCRPVAADGRTGGPARPDRRRRRVGAFGTDGRLPPRRRPSERPHPRRGRRVRRPLRLRRAPRPVDLRRAVRGRRRPLAGDPGGDAPATRRGPSPGSRSLTL
jgi:hypothetical protein